MPDADIIDLLLRREQRGLHLIYERYADNLFGVIVHMVRDEQEAELVLQDTFMKIWQRFDQYNKGKGRLLSWIFGIARYTALDRLRSKEYNSRLKMDEINHQMDRMPLQAVEINIDAIGLKELVYQMEPKYKMMIDLIYFGGYTQAEISDEMNIPLGTVKSRALKAIDLLRKLVKEHD